MAQHVQLKATVVGLAGSLLVALAGIAAAPAAQADDPVALGNAITIQVEQTTDEAPVVTIEAEETADEAPVVTIEAEPTTDGEVKATDQENPVSDEQADDTVQTTAEPPVDIEPINEDLGGELGAEATIPVHIFTFNDFHGRIDPAITVPWAYTLVDAALADPDNSMVVSAGDNVGASLFASSIDQDNPTIQLLNDIAGTPGVNFQASTVGNHEFDQGWADLQDRIINGQNPDGSAAPLKADWTYLGANVVSRTTGEPVLAPYYVYTLGNGLTVGVVGAVTRETASLVSPGGIATIEFTDPVAAVNSYADQLKDGNPANGEADIVVAVYHEGSARGQAADGGGMSDALSAPTIFPSLVNDTTDAVDAIVNGHTHQLYAWTGSADQDPAGLNEHPGRPVIQAQAYGAYVGQIDLTWDPATNQVVDAAAQVIPPVAADDVDLTLGNMQAIADHVAQALAEADVLGAPTVAAISADITTAFGGGVWQAGQGTALTYQNTGDATRDDRANESALATLVADSFLDTASSSPVVGGADIGIINAGGGLRAELLYALANGTIAYKDANAILPFANNLWTIELTGAQFKQFLEEQWQTAPDGSRPTRAFLATGVSSNVTFTVNTDQPGADPCTLEEDCAWDDPGSHITSVSINGAPLDPDKSYKILTISFLTNGGGDNYRVMNEGSNAQDTGLLDRDAWIAYLMKAAGTAEVGAVPTTPIAPSFARASVVVSNLTPATAPMASTVVQPGGHVSASLSRLNLTSLGSPANTSADIYLVGVGATGADGFLGTVPVTAPGDTAGCADAGVPGTLNPASTGCAAFDVVIPPNTAEGTYTLRVVVQPSGTTVSLPLTVVLPAGQPSALTSTVVIDTANSTATGGAARLADGKDSYTLTVTLKDSTGAALPGMAAHLSGHTPDGATVSAFTDQGNGVYTATVTAAQPGRHTAWVSVDDRALGATLVTAFIGTVPVAGATAGQVPVAGAGFQPDEPVSVTIDGKPLGTFPADSTGHVTITAALPSGLAVGSHQIELAGPASGKVVGTFTVSSGAKSETGGYVAPTGPLTALAILLFASGAVLVVAHRRLSSIR